MLGEENRRFGRCQKRFEPLLALYVRKALQVLTRQLDQVESMELQRVVFSLRTMAALQHVL